jgi:hypothetical protein
MCWLLDPVVVGIIIVLKNLHVKYFFFKSIFALRHRMLEINSYHRLKRNRRFKTNSLAYFHVLN